MPNRLADATSPYLRQHADNPVDWWPWGDAAFATARERDVPVFLSVGYSSCHWCHVMAHESFEDDEVAAVLNERFVAVKVDREERPDVDAVYMDATVALTGRGGWPMSVFCDHEGRPFLAGTYWPRTDRGGMPGFPRVLDAVHEAWTTERGRVAGSAAQIVEQLVARAGAGPGGAASSGAAPNGAGPGGDGPSTQHLSSAVDLVVDRAWDRNLGGFGRAPKFPQAMTIAWLLDHHVRTGRPEALEAAGHSLDAMARGGIHDQVGGGFARYSTDAHWLVPHFEKMLYDNALLVEAYANAAVLIDDASLAGRHANTAQGIAAYLAREMTTADGGFFAATDADSLDADGRSEEGAFFTWSADEYHAVVAGLDLDARRFADFHGVTESGNWEATNILHEPVPYERFCAERGLDVAGFVGDLGRVERALYERRAERSWPGLDDKTLTDWNGLAIRGLARAAVLLDAPAMLAQARSAAMFLLADHVDEVAAAEADEHVPASSPPDLRSVARAIGDGAAIWHTSLGRRPTTGPWAAGVVAGASRTTPTVPAFLDDLAALASGTLALFEADGDPGWFAIARALVERAERDYRTPGSSPTGGRWTRTPVEGAAGPRHDGPDLYLAATDPYDNATPAATSLLADSAVRLLALTGEPRFAELRDDLLRASGADLLRNPTAHGELARVLELVASGPLEVAIVGEPGEARDALVAATTHRGRAGMVVAVAEPSGVTDAHPALLHDRPTRDGRPTAYVCRAFTCELPVTDPAALRDLLGR